MPVHRPPDSRLLNNLITQEKEHAKQLAALFPVVNAALASLSAYATASGPPASPSAQSIAAVVDAFAAADDALHHRYAHAIDAWRAQLVALKDLEDDFAAVLRDRDILVTRLLKVSKSTRDTHRSSRLLTPPSTLGVSGSFTSLPSSTAASAPTPFVSAPGNTNNKLAQAQAELQACEAHLVAKEHELDARRIAVAHDGLGARCRALIDCAAVWAEMGKQGLRALQALGQNQNQSGSQNDGNPGGNSVAVSTPNHLGTHVGYPSDSSSLTPSQSASQTVAHSTEASHESPSFSKQHTNAHPQPVKPRSEPKPQVESEAQLAQKLKLNANEEADMILTIAVPPAHAIPDLTVPTGVQSRSPSSDDHSMPAPVAQQPALSKTATPLPRRRSNGPSRRPPSQHIAEVFDETSDGPSSASRHLPHSRSNDATKNNINSLALAPRSLSPQVFPTRDTSSSDESGESNDEYGDPSDGHPDGGPFQVVENDPFEVIRRSMVISPGPSVVLVPVPPNTVTDDPVLPSALVSLDTPRARTGLTVPTSTRASASAPDVRTSVEDPIAASASKSALGPSSVPALGVGWGLVSGPTLTPPQPAKRERRTSLAFFGSLRGLFRKPKGQLQQQQKARGAVTEWEDSDGGGSPEPAGRASTGARVGGNWRRGIKAAKGDGAGWVTRTDARIRGGRRVDEDSDIEAIATTNAATATTTTSNMISTAVDIGRRGSRLRKGRPGALAGSPSTRRGPDHGNASSGGSGIGSGNGSIPSIPIPVHVSKTVRANERTTDDSVGVGPGSKVMNIRSGRGTATETLTGESGLGRSRTTRRSVTRRRKTSVAGLRGSDQGQSDGEMIVGKGNQAKQGDPGPGMPIPRRAATTTAGTNHVDAAKTRRRRSASLSEVDVRLVMSSSSSTPSQMPTPSQPRTRTPSPKPHTRRQAQVGNGHAHKQHVNNQSLMSIVADVTGQHSYSRQDGDRGGATSSFDVARVPVSTVLSREVVVDRDRSPVQEVRSGGRLGMDTAIATTTNGRGHARSASSPESGRLDAEPGQGRGPARPLRSALRNASRTPSPGPVPVVTPVVRTTTTTTGTVVPRGGVAGVEAGQSRVRRSWRDSASVSSYATGRESLDGESRVPSPSGSRSRSPEPPFMIPPPPTVEPPVVRTRMMAGNGHANPNANAMESVTPSSTVSTETDTTAVAGTVKTRRKSVRMSLQPTFSPTPPAQYDEDDEDGEGKAPWSRAFSVEEGDRARARRRGGGNQPEDVWADSSEEDEAYGNARRLLSQGLDVGSAGGGNTHTHPDTNSNSKDKGKGKARARG